MQVKQLISGLVFGAIAAMPLAATAQTATDHAIAKSEVQAKDAHHHTKAKIVGGSAAGGAVVGGLAGGPVGAVAGGAVGAGGGVIANKIRKHHEIKKTEKENAGVPQK